MTIGKTCPCGHIHGYGDVVALSRFTGISGYRTPDGQIYETREDAQLGICPQWTTQSPEAASRPSLGSTAPRGERTP